MGVLLSHLSFEKPQARSCSASLYTSATLNPHAARCSEASALPGGHLRVWPAVLLSDSCIKQVLEQGKDAITVCRTVTCATCRPVQTRSRKHHAIPRNYLLRRPHTLRRRHRPSARARTGYLTIPGQRRRAKKCGNLRYNPEISSPAAPYFPPQTTKFPRKFPESKSRTATKFPKEFPEFSA